MTDLGDRSPRRSQDPTVDDNAGVLSMVYGLSRADLTDRWAERRITLIWGLLFFNVLPAIGGTSVLPLSRPVTQGMTSAALAVALLLALELNGRLLLRPNAVLALYSALAVTGLMASMRLTAGFGAIPRSLRLLGFILVLWLLTPWWGRRDLLLAKCHVRALLAVCATVVLGLVVAPSLARSGLNGRLIGVVWPIPGTAVGHFSAVAAGMAIVLWLSHEWPGIRALVFGGGGVALVLLSQSRSALLTLVAAVACAGLSLCLARRRVRRTLTVVLVAAPLVAMALAPAFSVWFQRNQSSEEIAGLTGRKHVWAQLLSDERSQVARWLGDGLSDKSFNGRPIDSGWLAVYQDQGLVGVVLVGLVAVFLVVRSAFHPASPARAMAVFLIVFCLVQSYTEVGIGDASPYFLEIIVAASLLITGADRQGSRFLQRQARLPASLGEP